MTTTTDKTETPEPVRSTRWLDDPPEKEGWYWMDYGMWTPIFPAFWNGHCWENSGGVRLNVEQFEKAQWQGPIFPIGREMNKSSNTALCEVADKVRPN